MIKVVNLTKNIKKNKVLHNVNYNFEGGKIYGLFGKNGSGKTMLLRAISGLIIPTQGEVHINGKQLHQDISFPPSCGVIIENMSLLPQCTGVKNLEILAKIKKIASKEEIINTIERVGLDPTSNLKVGKYSLGMRQRLNIAQAIFEKPDMILLDEPTNAIDDSGVELIYDILQTERNRGAAVIVASHQKEEIAPFCDQILTMQNGELLYDC
ncbi:ATP-binding cassette domain-containing protein [Pontibacillus litoralis]|uniref:Multidrug ABC transporter ATP-binding protein n=1 Tax=Pontibacillus litoralis JSM 072002 TaxID=1385512 RepID=A0A0A5HVM1_9BACI|nr:ABC transporter ATP-binding protein [Pontibacillus litoralis]KGX87697.1 multidrug ABC transporter ATP-binding protein [Pontibacillus litoralis JSM 072002]